jgi:DNA-binding response OmpR family regulator
MANEKSGDRRECAIGPADRERPRVLVVDDSRDTADTLQMLLADMGYEAHVAYEGDAALQLSQETAFAVVLLDLAMPGMDGFELAQRMRRSSAACPPFIAVTGWTDLRTRIRARGAGMECCLIKPVDIAELQRWLALLTEAVTVGTRTRAPAP